MTSTPSSTPGAGTRAGSPPRAPHTTAIAATATATAMTTRRPFGLGEGPMLHLLVMAETTDRCGINTLAELRARQDQALAAMVEPLNTNGGDRKTDKSVFYNNTESRGTTKVYRIRKLKRDHPEVAEKLAKGAYQTLPPPPPPP